MKKCSRCGAVQKNSRMNCIDCGAPLGKPLDDKSEAALEDMLDDKLDGLSERAEDFYVPLRDRILAVVCAVGIVAAIVMLYLVGGEQDRLDALKPDFPTDAESIENYLSNMETEIVIHTGPFDTASRQDAVNRAGASAVTALFNLIAAGFILMFPKLHWWLATLNIRFFLDSDPYPSYLWLILKKIGVYIVFATGIGALLYAYLIYFL